MHLLDFIFPKRCVACGRFGKYICLSCRTKIDWITAPVCPVCAKNAICGFTHPFCRKKYTLDGLLAFCRFRGPVKSAIHLAKYSLVRDLLPELTSIIFPRYSPFLPKFDYLLPVPLHRQRERERGFNQSQIIALELARKLGSPLRNKLLIRNRYTRPQTAFTRKNRRKNLLGAFSYSPDAEKLTGKSVALVDDVATTVSTLAECAKVLKRNGAFTVWGIVLAHG